MGQIGERIRLYFKLVGVAFRSQMQHRASFVMLASTHFISTFADIIGIWVLFDRFKLIQGWTLQEMAIIYGIIHMGFAVAEAFARGFDTFGDMVKSGDFDRILLRPLGTIFQVATGEIQMMRVGRFIQGLVVLLWGSYMLQFSLFSYHAFVILLAVVGATCLFSGLFIIQGTLSFWSTSTLELMNITTYGGVETGQYPMSIFNRGFRLFFTFIIPLACVGYYPVATLLHHVNVPFYAGIFAPVAGIIFLWLSCQLWKLGVRHYHSTGS